MGCSGSKAAFAISNPTANNDTFHFNDKPGSLPDQEEREDSDQITTFFEAANDSMDLEPELEPEEVLREIQALTRNPLARTFNSHSSLQKLKELFVDGFQLHVSFSFPIEAATRFISNMAVNITKGTDFGDCIENVLKADSTRLQEGVDRLLHQELQTAVHQLTGLLEKIPTILEIENEGERNEELTIFKGEVHKCKQNAQLALEVVQKPEERIRCVQIMVTALIATAAVPGRNAAILCVDLKYEIRSLLEDMRVRSDVVHQLGTTRERLLSFKKAREARIRSVIYIILHAEVFAAVHGLAPILSISAEAGKKSDKSRSFRYPMTALLKSGIFDEKSKIKDLAELYVSDKKGDKQLKFSDKEICILAGFLGEENPRESKLVSPQKKHEDYHEGQILFITKRVKSDKSKKKSESIRSLGGAALGAGAEAEAEYKAGRGWRKCTVKKDHGNGTYDVEYLEEFPSKQYGMKCQVINPKWQVCNDGHHFKVKVQMHGTNDEKSFLPNELSTKQPPFFEGDILQVIKEVKFQKEKKASEIRSLDGSSHPLKVGMDAEAKYKKKSDEFKKCTIKKVHNKGEEYDIEYDEPFKSGMYGKLCKVVDSSWNDDSTAKLKGESLKVEMLDNNEEKSFMLGEVRRFPGGYYEGQKLYVTKLMDATIGLSASDIHLLDPKSTWEVGTLAEVDYKKRGIFHKCTISKVNEGFPCTYDVKYIEAIPSNQYGTEVIVTDPDFFSENGRVKVHAPDKLKSSIIEEQKSPFRTFKPNELDEKMPPFHVHDIIVVDKMIEKEKKKKATEIRRKSPDGEKLPLRQGEKAEAEYKKDRGWHECTILTDHGDGTYDIKYDVAIKSGQWGNFGQILNCEWDNGDCVKVKMLHLEGKNAEKSFKTTDIKLCRDANRPELPDEKFTRELSAVLSRLKLDKREERRVLRQLSSGEWPERLKSPKNKLQLVDLPDHHVVELKKLIPEESREHFDREISRLQMERENLCEVYLVNHGAFVAEWYKNDWTKPENKMKNGLGREASFSQNLNEGNMRITAGAWLGAYVTDRSSENRHCYLAIEFHKPGRYKVEIEGRAGT